MPDGLLGLAEEAEREGIRVLSAVVGQWVDGTLRFDAPGEAILAATSVDGVVGIGALSVCPHVAGALRVRRFYVAPSWRRRGVARALATELIANGFGRVDTITCNAQASLAAPPFWESMGFVPVDTAGITHLRRR